MPLSLLFLRVALAISGLVEFHMNFRIAFSVSVKKKKGHFDFDQDCMNL